MAKNPGMRPRSRLGMFLVLLAVLAGVPVWTLPLVVVGKHGFVAYLFISDAYYGFAEMVLGSAHFSRREFGTLPTSGAGYLLAAGFYALFAFALCWFVPLPMAEHSEER